MRKFAYFFGQGIKYMTTHKFMSFASVCIVTASLILFGLFAIIGINVNSVIDQLGSSYEINVYLSNNDRPQPQIIKSNLEDIDGVTKAKYFSREDRLKKVTEEVYGEDAYAFEEGENPLRDSFVVTISDLSLVNKITDDISMVDGIDEIIQSSDIVSSIEKISNAVKHAGIILFIIFILMSMFIISNTINLGMVSHGEEIKIMNIVGATKGFIRTPFVIQGLLFGIIAALAASVIIVFGYNFVVDKMIAMFGSGVIEFINTKNMAVFIVPLFFIIGSVIGVFGSASSVNKYLKERTK